MNKKSKFVFLKGRTFLSTLIIAGFVFLGLPSAGDAQAQVARHGDMITISGGPFAVYGVVAQEIRAKGLPLTPPNQPLLRSTGGTGHLWTWNDDGIPHMPTLQAVCRVMGYQTYVSSTCLDTERSHRYPNGKCYWHTPHDNQITFFSGNNFVLRAAGHKHSHTWIASITCKDPIDTTPTPTPPPTATPTPTSTPTPTPPPTATPTPTSPPTPTPTVHPTPKPTFKPFPFFWSSSAQIMQHQEAWNTSQVNMKQQAGIDIWGPFNAHTSASAAQGLQGFGSGPFRQQQGIHAHLFSPIVFPSWGHVSW